MRALDLLKYVENERRPAPDGWAWANAVGQLFWPDPNRPSQALPMHYLRPMSAEAWQAESIRVHEAQRALRPDVPDAPAEEPGGWVELSPT